MKNAVTRPERCLSVLKGIPSQSNARFEIVPIVFVERRQSVSFPCDLEGERGRATGTREERRKQIIDFRRNAVELVAQAIAQR